MLKYKILTNFDNNYLSHLNDLEEYSNIYLQSTKKYYTVNGINKQNFTIGLLSYKVLLLLIQEYYNDNTILLPTIIREKNSKAIKPYFKGLDIQFNISHTKNGVCAVISDKPCGIDIESNHLVNINIKNKICNENDLLFLFKDEYVNNNLLKIWTIKESISKLTGDGLRIGFKNILIDYDTNMAYINNNCKKSFNFKHLLINNTFFVTISCDEKWYE